MKKILILLLFFFVAMNLQEIHPDDDRRAVFYNKILENLPEKDVLTLHVDKYGLYIFNNKDYKAGNSMFTVPKEYIISGCDFYPFREHIFEILYDFVEKNPLLEKNNIVNTFTLVYHLLYVRLADKRKAKIYYKKYKNQKKDNEFFEFALNKYKKEFMMAFPKRPTFTAFEYNKEELDFIRTIGGDLEMFDLSMKIFEFVHDKVNALTDVNLKEALLPMVSDETFFKKYSDVVIRRALSLSVDGSATIEDYRNYQKLFKSKRGIDNKVCRILAPLFDLFRHIPIENGSVQASLTVDPASGIKFGLNAEVPAQTLLGVTYTTVNSNEVVYPLFGQYIEDFENSGISVPFTYHKKDFSQRKAHLCSVFKCGGFDIQGFAKSSTMSYTGQILVNKDKINKDLYSLIKLVNMKEIELDKLEFLLKKFEKHANLDNETEMRTRAKYLQHFIELDKQTLDFKNILDNLKYLRFLYEKVSLKEFSEAEADSTFPILERMEELSNKVNLLTIGLNKKRVIYSHINLMNKEIEKAFFEKMSKLKNNFIN